MAVSGRKLTKRDIFIAYVNWITFSLSCQNMERMMAPAFVRMLGRVADKLYDNEEDKKEMLMRHTQFFNTEETVGAIVPGIVLGMEEQKAMGEDIPGELISSVKTALMGPFAGIGDSVMGGAVRPILLSIALGLCGNTGSIAGPLFYTVCWLGCILPLSYFLFYRGYKTGIKSAETVLSSQKDAVIRMANIVALIVIGAVAAQYVAFKSNMTFSSGNMVVGLQSALDGIFPSLVPLLLTLFAWYLLDKKKIRTGYVFGIFIVIAIVGVLSGVMVAP